MIIRSSLTKNWLTKISQILSLAVVLFAGTEVAAQDSQSVLMTLRLQDAATVTASASEFKTAYDHADVSVLNVEEKNSAVQLVRHIEYSADQIVVVGLSEDGTEKSRVVMVDPRLIRTEAFVSGDQWESSVRYRRSVDFSVALPNQPAIVTINVLKPRWTGSEWLFDVLAETVIK